MQFFTEPPGKGVASKSSALESKVYKLDSYPTNILSYAHTLPDDSFTVMKYYGYGTEGSPINAAPTNANGIAYIARNTYDYMTIIAVPYDNSGSYTRVKDAGAWSGWMHS